jgi:hypothetical protein
MYGIERDTKRLFHFSNLRGMNFEYGILRTVLHCLGAPLCKSLSPRLLGPKQYQLPQHLRTEEEEVGFARA